MQAVEASPQAYLPHKLSEPLSQLYHLPTYLPTLIPTIIPAIPYVILYEPGHACHVYVCLLIKEYQTYAPGK